MWPSNVPIYQESVSLYTKDQDPEPGICEHVDLMLENSPLESDTIEPILIGFLDAMVLLINHSNAPELTVSEKKTIANNTASTI